MLVTSMPPERGLAVAGNRPKKTEFSNAYEMFILVLTLLSLAIMVLLVVPFSEATNKLLQIYDNLICVVFLVDFCLRLRRASSPGQYFFHERGWIDLLGSIPSLGVLRYSGLLRLFRLSRLARIVRLLRGKKRDEIVKDVLAHRGQYAAFITILAAGVVLVVASIVELAFETAPGADGNITTGGDALWWAIVTMTTVGYGDHFPVTTGGRITAAFVMFMGVGIIGALASILASFLVAPSSSENTEEQAAVTDQVPVGTAAAEGTPVEAEAAVSSSVEEELRAMRAELEALRRSVDAKGSA
jgi:voltage-gated potassium channel